MEWAALLWRLSLRVPWGVEGCGVVGGVVVSGVVVVEALVMAVLVIGVVGGVVMDWVAVAAWGLVVAA